MGINPISWWFNPYPLVISHSYWTWLFIVNFPNGGSFHSYVSLPDGKPSFSYGFPMVFPAINLHFPMGLSVNPVSIQPVWPYRARHWGGRGTRGTLQTKRCSAWRSHLPGSGESQKKTVDWYGLIYIYISTISAIYLYICWYMLIYFDIYWYILIWLIIYIYMCVYIRTSANIFRCLDIHPKKRNWWSCLLYPHIYICYWGFL